MDLLEVTTERRGRVGRKEKLRREVKIFTAWRIANVFCTLHFSSRPDPEGKHQKSLSIVLIC